MRSWPFLVLVFLAAGCFGGPSDDGPGDAGGSASFDPADPSLPHAPDGSLDTSLLGTPDDPGFPRFAAPVVMNGTFGAARETSIALGPAGTATVLACDPSGVPNTSGGQSYFYLSTDAGLSFTDLDVEVEDTDLRQYAFEGGDCDVTVGPGGELWTADTWLGSLSVGRSRDGGASWDGTSLAGTAPGVDRPWLATDGSGTLHLTYQDVQALMPSAIWYTRLVSGPEGVLAFQPAVSVTTVAPGGGFTWTGNLVVSEDGQTLWSVYTRRLAPVTTDLEGSGPETVWVARSVDGGLTWTQAKVSDRPAPASFLYASIARDGLGMLHVVFAQRTAAAHPIFHSWSSDDGSTWSEPVIVRDGVAAYSPWVAGAAHGGAAIQWYGSPNPAADLQGNETAWYTYWATATPDAAGGYVHRSGTTTSEPLFAGTQGETPEFNMVRLDSQGRMQLGISAPGYDAETESTYWRALYQSQSAGPAMA